jgi:nicotinamidase/pyrazinamidase
LLTTKKKENMEKTHLLIIDPQVDFCDPNGSLYVNGAEKDMERLSAFIRRVSGKIERIHVTLDSHQLFDIAHPLYWVSSSGTHPDPFTIISVDDVKNGVWRPKIPSLSKRSLDYVESLQANGRYALCIWPPHCLIGTSGYAIYPELMNELNNWSKSKVRMVNYVSKGSNPFTEHYSAIAADVPDPADPSTQINDRLIKVLSEVDNVLIAGEASSHCVLNTVKDIADNFGDESIKKLIWLSDATSPVIAPGIDFPQIATDFVNEMVTRGMRVSTTTEWMA